RAPCRRPRRKALTADPPSGKRHPFNNGSLLTGPGPFQGFEEYAGFLGAGNGEFPVEYEKGNSRDAELGCLAYVRLHFFGKGAAHQDALRFRTVQARLASKPHEGFVVGDVSALAE